MTKYLFPLIFALAACTSTEKTTPEKAKTPETIVAHFANENEMDNRMVVIDALVAQSGMVASSLNYRKQDGTFVKVLAYLSKDNVILKIEEQYSDGNEGNMGSVTYYMNDGKPFVTHELLDEVDAENAHEFVDRISYYNPSGKVIKTKERRGYTQDESEQKAFVPVGLHAVTIDRAMRALNAKNEFAITFQGFAYQEALTYLIVGENKENGFTSTLKCDFQDQLLFTLSKNQEAFIGKPLKVTFNVEEDQGFEYQVYTGGSFSK
jgi:hypothetical protein